MWVYITQVIYINYRLFLVSIDYSYTMDMFLLFFFISVVSASLEQLKPL
jgi:hypothetical protein